MVTSHSPSSERGGGSSTTTRGGGKLTYSHSCSLPYSHSRNASLANTVAAQDNRVAQTSNVTRSSTSSRRSASASGSTSANGNSSGSTSSSRTPRWFSHVKDWLSVNEPSAQAIKQSKTKPPKAVGGSSSIPRGRIPTWATTSTAGPAPEEALVRDAMSRQTRRSFTSANRTTQSVASGRSGCGSLSSSWSTGASIAEEGEKSGARYEGW